MTSWSVWINGGNIYLIWVCYVTQEAASFEWGPEQERFCNRSGLCPSSSATVSPARVEVPCFIPTQPQILSALSSTGFPRPQTYPAQTKHSKSLCWRTDILWGSSVIIISILVMGDGDFERSGCAQDHIDWITQPGTKPRYLGSVGLMFRQGVKGSRRICPESIPLHSSDSEFIFHGSCVAPG